MSLLTVIKDACDRVGIARPAAAYISTDVQILQLVGLAQQEGKELAKRHTWQAITKEKTFTSTAAETQANAIPDDFDRFVDETFYNRSQARGVQGPLTAIEWQFNKSVVASTIIQAFRQRGNSILITPTPTEGETLAYEYVSRNWCQSNASVEQSAWASDTDTGLLDEELMTLGLVWRWQKAKGLDYAESFRTYEMQVAQVITRDGGKPRLNVGRTNSIRNARAPYVPDGNWTP
jgi:hypothetical protein